MNTENKCGALKTWELVNFCEFDKYAVKSYCAIHNESEDKNLGDITKVDETKLNTFNMVVGGSPCQDFSVAGKQKGSVWTCKDCGSEYNPLTVHWSKRNTCPHCNSENLDKSRSSLLVEWLRVIRGNRPNFGIYENVKNIVGKQFKETFKMFTDELIEYDYDVYWKVLNAKDYGVPQNRERVYLIIIKKEFDNGKFKYPTPFDNGIRLKDILEDDVDEKYYISEDKVKKFLNNLTFNVTSDENNPKFLGNINRPDFGTGYAGGVWDIKNISPTLTTMQGGGRQPHIITSLVSNKGEKFERETEVANTLLARDYKGFGNQAMNAVIERSNHSTIAVKQATKKGYIECEIGGVADLSYPDSKTRRGRVQDGGMISPTITATETGICRIESQIKIRKLIPLECYRLMGFSDSNFKAAEKVVSNSQLYKQAGNSIVVDVLYYILVELYKAMPYLFNDLKLGSYFSGIGAFETALDRLFEGINSGNFTQPQVD
ncbi:DNA (cytosine-5-)-methyltransferase [Lacrimispora sp.]|uniref:DNA (cytosine-5-)-methyltransferase n=1 Tax=Lacrimispora sp. TaxID=2719234 RepID=UPI0028A97007|nr:DNA (cytosine-5-)-methyltransferase [Lacrimispora sp.]